MSALHEVESPPADAVSSLKFTPGGGLLAVASWDSHIHIYERLEHRASLALWRQFECRAPVLDLCWRNDGQRLFFVGLDGDVGELDFESETMEAEVKRRVLSTHGEPSNKVVYSEKHGVVVSTSWDSTMHVHDPESGAYIRVKLADKPFAISLTPERAVVAMAERKVSVYDLNALKMLVDQTGGTADRQSVLEIQPWQERESSLKFMTRAVACLTDGTGFATSSIEGRVGVEWFDPEEQKKTYAFKCHRESQKRTNEEGQEQDVDVIYPVNALAFHPIHGTFATGGGDGVVAIWDAQTKRRVKQYHKLDESIAAMDFSPDGKFLAIGISPGFEDGKEDEEIDPSRVKVFVRELAANEAKGKEAKTKSKPVE